MLSKFRKYESKLIIPSKLIDSSINITYFPVSIGKAARRNYKRLMVYYYVRRLDRRVDLHYGLLSAAKGGYEDLVLFFLNRGIRAWYHAITGASFRGYSKIIDIFILYKDDDWDSCMAWASEGKHRYLVEFFRNKKDLY